MDLMLCGVDDIVLRPEDGDLLRPEADYTNADNSVVNSWLSINQDDDDPDYLARIFNIHDKREAFILQEVRKIIANLKATANLKASASASATSSASASARTTTNTASRALKYPPPRVPIGTKVTIYTGSDSNGYEVVSCKPFGTVLHLERCDDEGRLMRGVGELSIKWNGRANRGKGQWVTVGPNTSGGRRRGGSSNIAFGQAINYRDPGF